MVRQVWVQVRAPAGHLAITPEGYSRRQSKVLTAKSMAQLLPLGVALRHSLGGLDGRANTQGVSESAAIAAGRDRLAWGKSATTLSILIQFESRKVLLLCRYRAATSHLFFMWNEIFDGIGEQCSAHHFAQWSAHCFARSLVSYLKYDIGTNQHVPNRIL